MSQNKYESVKFTGGLIGFFKRNSSEINAMIERNNAEGWKVVAVIPPVTGLASALVSSLILVCTLGLYTTSPGSALIFEKVN